MDRRSDPIRSRNSENFGDPIRSDPATLARANFCQNLNENFSSFVLIKEKSIRLSAHKLL